MSKSLELNAAGKLGKKGRRMERRGGRGYPSARGMEGRLTEGSGTGVSDEGAAFEPRRVGVRGWS